MWSLLSVMTVATRADAALSTDGHDLRDRRAGGAAELVLAARCDPRAQAVAARLGGRRRRAVRLSRAVFPRAALRAAGRSGPAELSLAAADRAVLVAAAGRAAGVRITSSARCSGLAGTVLLLRRQCAPSFAPGHDRRVLLAAFVAAFVWAAYSVMSRKLKAVPTDAVAGFCLATARAGRARASACRDDGLAGDNGQWLAIDRARRSGPSARRSIVWDIGMKRGDIRVLGAASYATPLLSTAFLILAGFAQPTATIAIAAVLIAGGGLIAAKDMVWREP